MTLEQIRQMFDEEWPGIAKVCAAAEQEGKTVSQFVFDKLNGKPEVQTASPSFRNSFNNAKYDEMFKALRELGNDLLKLPKHDWRADAAYQAIFDAQDALAQGMFNACEGRDNPNHNYSEPSMREIHAADAEKGDRFF